MDQHTAVEGGSFHQAFLEIRAVVALRHADGGTEIGRFREQRIIANLFSLLDDRKHVAFDLGPQDEHHLDDRDIVGDHDILEDAFIHANRRAYHARAHVRYICQLEQTLNGSVFAECPVQGREEDVDGM